MASEVYRELGEAAWAWVMGQVREEDGPWLPEVVPADGSPAEPGEDRDSLYAGIGGLAPVLAEIGRYRALSRAEQALAAGIVARLRAMAAIRTEPSLYDGPGAPVVDRPDQWWAVPARLRTVCAGRAVDDVTAPGDAGVCDGDA